MVALTVERKESKKAGSMVVQTADCLAASMVAL